MPGFKDNFSSMYKHLIENFDFKSGFFVGLRKTQAFFKTQAQKLKVFAKAQCTGGFSVRFSLKNLQFLIQVFTKLKS